MNLRIQMIKAFDSYCDKTGLSPATVSTMVMNYGGFYDRLTSGKGFTISTYEKVMAWFAANTPKNNLPTTTKPKR